MYHNVREPYQCENAGQEIGRGSTGTLSSDINTEHDKTREASNL